MQSSRSPTIVSPYTARTVPVLKLARTRVVGPRKRVFKVPYIPKKVDILPGADTMMQQQQHQQDDPSYQPNDGTKAVASDDEFCVDGLQSAHRKASSSPRDRSDRHNRGQKSPRSSNNGHNNNSRSSNSSGGREVHKLNLAALSIDSNNPAHSPNQSAALTESKPPSTTGGSSAFPRRKILQAFNDDLEYDLEERKRWPVKKGSSAIPQTLFRNPDIIGIRSDKGGGRFTKALPTRFFIKNPTSSLQMSRRPLPQRNVHPPQQKNNTIKRKEDPSNPISDDQEDGINYNVPFSQHEVSIDTTTTTAAAAAAVDTKSEKQVDVTPRINVNISKTLRLHAKALYDVEPSFPHNHMLDDCHVMHSMLLTKKSSDKEQAGHRPMKTHAAAPANASRSSQVGANSSSKDGIPLLQSRPAHLNMPVSTPGGSARGNRPTVRVPPQNSSSIAVDRKIDDGFIYSVEINENSDLLVLDDSPQSNACSPEVDRREELHKQSFKATLFIDPLTGHTTAATRGGGLFHIGEKNPDAQQQELFDASSAIASNLAKDAHLETAPRQPSVEMEEASELQLPIARRHISQNALELIQAAQLKPLSGQQILNELTTWSELLTDYEKAEIVNYPTVYFAGRNVADKQHVSVIPGGPHELVRSQSEIDETSPAHQDTTYCNDAGSYISHVGDHLFYRYEIIQAMGTGSFGDVYECFDYKDSKHVAIKVIKNKAKYLTSALEEKKMLELVALQSTKADSSTTIGKDSSLKSSSSTCIVELLHHFEFRSHHCFVFPRYGKNLFEFLQQRDFTGLPISFIKKVAIQLLNALVHLHQLGIVHCDLKPENILIRDEKQCSVVLIDFGNSCLASETLFTYIQSRFYRSPEVLFGLPYGMRVLMLFFYITLLELTCCIDDDDDDDGDDNDNDDTCRSGD